MMCSQMLRATVLGSAGTLATAGLSSGDSIVVLATPRPLPPPAPDRTTVSGGGCHTLR